MKKLLLLLLVIFALTIGTNVLADQPNPNETGNTTGDIHGQVGNPGKNQACEHRNSPNLDQGEPDCPSPSINPTVSPNPTTSPRSTSTPSSTFLPTSTNTSMNSGNGVSGDPSKSTPTVLGSTGNSTESLYLMLLNLGAMLTSFGALKLTKNLK